MLSLNPGRPENHWSLLQHRWWKKKLINVFKFYISTFILPGHLWIAGYYYKWPFQNVLERWKNSLSKSPYFVTPSLGGVEMFCHCKPSCFFLCLKTNSLKFKLTFPCLLFFNHMTCINQPALNSQNPILIISHTGGSPYDPLFPPAIVNQSLCWLHFQVQV